MSYQVNMSVAEISSDESRRDEIVAEVDMNDPLHCLLQHSLQYTFEKNLNKWRNFFKLNFFLFADHFEFLSQQSKRLKVQKDKIGWYLQEKPHGWYVKEILIHGWYVKEILILETIYILSRKVESLEEKEMEVRNS